MVCDHCRFFFVLSKFQHYKFSVDLLRTMKSLQLNCQRKVNNYSIVYTFSVISYMQSRLRWCNNCLANHNLYPKILKINENSLASCYGDREQFIKKLSVVDLTLNWQRFDEHLRYKLCQTIFQLWQMIKRSSTCGWLKWSDCITNIGSCMISEITHKITCNAFKWSTNLRLNQIQLGSKTT